MAEQQLMQQGVDLMLFGMGTVFVFLSLLVLSTVVMSTFINKWFPEPVAELAPPAMRPSVEEPVSPEIMTAISLAIRQHRARKK